MEDIGVILLWNIQLHFVWRSKPNRNKHNNVLDETNAAGNFLWQESKRNKRKGVDIERYVYIFNSDTIAHDHTTCVYIIYNNIYKYVYYIYIYCIYIYIYIFTHIYYNSHWPQYPQRKINHLHSQIIETEGTTFIWPATSSDNYVIEFVWYIHSLLFSID